VCFMGRFPGDYIEAMKGAGAFLLPNGPQSSRPPPSSELPILLLLVRKTAWPMLLAFSPFGKVLFAFSCV
jgi:hypothetical protein